MPLQILDTKGRFRQEIIDYFIDGYRRGETPAPCTRCNPQIKWLAFHGVTVVLAGDEGAGFAGMGNRLVRAAVAVLQLAGVGTGSQGGELVAQADAEGGDAGVQHLADVCDDLNVLGRVAGAVREHQAIRVQRSKLGRGCGAGQNRHAAAALLQAAHDVVLAAQIQQGHVQRGVTPRPCCGRLIGFGLAAGDGLDGIGHGVGTSEGH